MTERPSEFLRALNRDRHRSVTTPELHEMQREAERLEARAARADDLEHRIEVHEPDIYGPGGGYRHSWFADIARVTKQYPCDADGGRDGAAERLAASERYEHRRNDRFLRRLAAEREIELALTRTPAEYIAYERWREAGGVMFERQDELRDLERRGTSNVPGSGGYFDPPVWMTDQFVHAPRTGAPLAALWTRLPLPLRHGDTINVPRFAAGSGAGTSMQPADGVPVAFRDPTDGTAQGTVRTLAAILDASMQLMDMSPVPFDETFVQDIREDFATQTDGQLLLGNNTNGQLAGIIPGGTFSAANSLLLQSTNNTSSQTWVNGGTNITSSAHQMTAQLYSKFARYRGLPATHFVASPDVWAIIAGTADGGNRPLVVPGVTDKTLHGLPFVEDENLTSTFGGSIAPSVGITSGVTAPTAGNGGYAPVLLGRWADLLYFASAPEVQVMQDVLSGTMGVRYRVMQYIASMPDRVVWGGSNQAFSGTDQSGGLNAGANVGYGAFIQQTTNSPLQPAANGF
jgi:HK97 family phage major capsid protein